MGTDVDHNDSSVAIAEPEQPEPSAGVANMDQQKPDDSGLAAAGNAKTTNAPPQKAENSETPDEAPKNSYAVISAPNEPEPFGPVIEVQQQLPVEEPAPKPAKDRTILFAALVAGLGLFAGIGVANNLWRFSSPTGPGNLSPITFSAYGLRGNLVTKWEDKLQYHLTIEPIDSKQRAGFAYAVSHSPRPLSFDIQLKDPLGFVLCSNTILVKFDPQQAAVLAAPDGASPASGD